MRTESSVKNSIAATIMIVIKVLVGFIAQKIFVLLLGAEYLGANGLFTNIIALLSLAELGIGEAIIFNLYKPIAENNKETIKSLMKLYKKAYNLIAFIVLVIGSLMIPFLDIFIGETNLSLNFTLVYILFLLQCIVSYMFTYKRSILYAYQENYIISILDIIYILCMNAAQLLILYFTKNYYLYLFIKAVCILVENVIITVVANKKYPFISEKNVERLDSEIEKDIFARIKAQLFHKVGTIIINGTDNIIISKFIGLLTVGIYSNYYMILFAVSEVIRQMIAALMPSIGNLLTENDQEHAYSIYKKIKFLNSWLSTFCTVSILVIIQSFVTLWMGEALLFPITVVVVLVVNQYLKMMRTHNDVFLGAAGICVETKYVPLVESCLNIVFSILLIKPFGVAGVFMGTIISSMALWCYTYPKYCYKNILGRSYKEYIAENVVSFLIFCSIAVITYCISLTINVNNGWLDIVIRCGLCLAVPNVILYLLYRKTEEMDYFKDLISSYIKKI